MTDDHSVSSTSNLEDVTTLQRRLDAAEALARERLQSIQTLEWERDRLRVDLEEQRAEASVPAPRLPGADLPKAGPPEPGPAKAGLPRPPGTPSLARRLARAVYRVFRPVLRPVAWRARNFLVGELRQELAEVSRRQEVLLGMSKSGTGIMDPAFVASIERLLLTLALEQRRDCPRSGAGVGLSKAESDR